MGNTMSKREMRLFLLSAVWGAFLIVLFGIVIMNDKNAPDPGSSKLFTYIVHTDRGSFFSGIAGPIYTVTNTIAGKDAGVILDDTWGQGSGSYKLGFIAGCIMLITASGPIGCLAALIKYMTG